LAARRFRMEDGKTDIPDVVSDMPYQLALTLGFGKEGKILAGWAPARTFR